MLYIVEHTNPQQDSRVAKQTHLNQEIFKEKRKIEINDKRK